MPGKCSIGWGWSPLVGDVDIGRPAAMPSSGCATDDGMAAESIQMKQGQKAPSFRYG
jgi:hypothetical protein